MLLGKPTVALRTNPRAVPGRVDALVWALTDLMAQPMPGWNIFELTRRLAAGQTIAQIAAPVAPSANPLLEVYRAAQRGIVTPPVEDNRVGWRRRYDEMSAGSTPSHPNCTGGAVEHLNGRQARPTYAPGSLEYAQERGEQ
jgi:hypothetical protein